MLKAGVADTLLVNKVVAQVGEGILNLAGAGRSERWNLMVLDIGMDLRSPFGKAVAHMVSVFAQLERDTIALRTSEALRVKEANGVALGRRRNVPDDVVSRILREFVEGFQTSSDRAPTQRGWCTYSAGRLSVEPSKRCVPSLREG